MSNPTGKRRDPYLLSKFKSDFEKISSNKDFQDELYSKGIIPSKEYHQGNYIDYIINADPVKIIKILRDLKLDIYSKLADKIVDFWNGFIRKAKDYKLYQITSQLQSKFDSENQPERRKFKDLRTPIRIFQKKPKTLTNSSVSNEDIMKWMKENQNVFIYGKAGIGKTFHSFDLLNYSINSSAYENYLILYVDLSLVKKDDEFEDVIFTQNFDKKSPETKDDLIYYLQQENLPRDAKIVFLFDCVEQMTLRESDFYEIIHGKKIDHPLIVWSRSNKSDELKGLFDVVLEITGFSPQSIKMYFENFFDEYSNMPERYENKHDTTDNTIESKKDLKPENNNKTVTTTNISKDKPYFNNSKLNKSSELINFLEKKRRDLFELCESPLFANLIATVWNREQKSMETVFTIFDKFVKHSLSSCLLRNSDDVDSIINQVGDSALENLLNRNEQMKIPYEIWKTSNCIGGLALKLDHIANSVKFQFYNTDFQEYFAAVSIINANDKKLDDILKEENNLIHLQYVLELIQNFKKSMFDRIRKKKPSVMNYLPTQEIVSLFKNRDPTKLITNRFMSLSELNTTSMCFQNDEKASCLKFQNVFFKFKCPLDILSQYTIDNLTDLEISNKYDNNEISSDSIREMKNKFKKLKSFCLKNLRISKCDERIKFPQSLSEIKMIQVENFPNLDFNLPNIRRINFSHSHISQL